MIFEGYLVEAEGEDSVTCDVSTGPFVRSPYVIVEQNVGKPFTLGAPMIRAFASGIGMIDKSDMDEMIDMKDQIINDLNIAVEELDAELKLTKPAAERYWIEQGQMDGVDYETQIAELKAKCARQQEQLQKFHTGRPKKKEEATA